MKQFKVALLGLVIGLAVGLALGVNIGREQPLLSNPFVKESLGNRLKRMGSETLERSGGALKKTGEALQGK